jgi:hypothetical protein
MPTCPICQTESPAEAEVCTGCGAFRFRADSDSATYTLTATPAVTPADDVIPLAGLDLTPIAPAADRPAPPPPPRLLVIRGQRVNAEYMLLEGKNYIGRTTDQPVDIDLTGQEPPDQVWSSRKHAVLTWGRGVLTVEDMNSLNGTFVNRTRLTPGQSVRLAPGDVIAIGVVQLKVVT